MLKTLPRSSNETTLSIQADALDLARQSENTNTENTVFLGCLSALNIFPIEESDFKQSISEAVPKKTVDQNLKAFDLGKKSAYDSLCTLVPCREIH
jgi:indolepyruvate ferredoxin oxidoreductase beta subunit